MAVSYRFSRNLQVAIKDSERYSSKLDKSLWGRGSFLSKIEIRGMPSRLSEYISEHAVLKELL